MTVVAVFVLYHHDHDIHDGQEQHQDVDAIVNVASSMGLLTAAVMMASNFLSCSVCSIHYGGGGRGGDSLVTL